MQRRNDRGDVTWDPSRHPNPLADHYTRFRVSERLLLTGHSHQAWPDCGLDAQQRAWLDAAEHVDAKWEAAFAQAERVRRGFARLLDDPAGDYALASNTHELLVRFLSALDLRRRPRLVTTDGEFFTIRRQLARLAEEGLDVVRIAAEPADSLAERLARAVDDGTSAVLVSAVLYRSARIVPNLRVLAAACERRGVPLLVDAYHAVNALAFSVRREGLEDCYVVGGGYKYCQLGEGNGFLRVPAGCDLRPVITGWFAEFEHLEEGGEERVAYGEGAARFAGATYDPTSHYRAAAVFEFFVRSGLDPARLREISRHQLRVLARAIDSLDLPARLVGRNEGWPLESLAGFLVLESPHAADLCRGLAARGVSTDYRGTALRLGPAPYLSDQQLSDAVTALGEAALELLR